ATPPLLRRTGGRRGSMQGAVGRKGLAAPGLWPSRVHRGCHVAGSRVTRRDSFLVFGSPQIEQPEIDEVIDSLKSGWIGTGPKVKRFEDMLATYVGAGCVRCVSSCTAALFLALRGMEITAGDEVIVPAMTYVASAHAVEQAGAKPVIVDVDPETGLIDWAAVDEAITTRTKAIMPVHLAGRPVDMDTLTAVRDKSGLRVIEDAAHALGARWRGRQIGSFG